MNHFPWMHRDRPRALLLGPGHAERQAELVEPLMPRIAERLEIVAVDHGFDEQLDDVEADFAVVFGGDGAILRAARQMGERQIPVLGVNLGRLGFLAALSPADFLAALHDVCQGNCRVASHLMFRCQVLRHESEGAAAVELLGLNEAAILAGFPFGMLHVDLYVDADLATTYSCDGLIISTPVGSTAHSLSAGGPILRKTLQAFVISPISPHTLTVRPVVDAAERVFEMAVRQPNEGTSLVVDGRLICRLGDQDRVRVERAAAQFQMIEVGGTSYYGTLREKLGWRGNLRENS